MITVIRKNQKKFMLVVAILTVIAFAWLYNPADPNELGANVAARVYGGMVTPADMDRIGRTYHLAAALGFREYISSLTALASSEEEALSLYAFNVMVLRHEAGEFGVAPTSAQIADRIRSLPVFQENGAFSPAKFEEFSAGNLAPSGLTTLSLEDTIRDVLTFERIYEVVASTAVLSRADTLMVERMWLPADIILLSFPREAVMQDVKVSDEEAQRYYESHRSIFVSPEKLSVQAAIFELPEAEQALSGRERVTALQKLAGQVSGFLEPGTGADRFAAAASESGARLENVGPFARDGGQPLPREVARAAFLMPRDSDRAEVVQVEDSFYVFRITGREEERPLTFEEARPDVIRRLETLEAGQTVQRMATAKIDAIREAVAGGERLPAAIEASGVQSRVLSGVVSVNPSDLPIFDQAAARAIPFLEKGQVSNFIPNALGGSAVALLGRSDSLPAEFDAASVKRQLLQNRKSLLFLNWLTNARDAAQIVIPNRGRG